MFQLFFIFQISNLITPAYLPSMNASEVLTKQNNLARVLSKYCGSLPGCGIPTPDLVPVVFDTVIAPVKQETIFCRPGYSVLSCGIDGNKD